MPVEMAIWRMTECAPVRLEFAALDSEKVLEDTLVRDLTLTGLEVLLVGRQVLTDFGGFVDIMGVDETGRVHIVELKKDRTPRDVVAQILDYGSWARRLTLEEVRAIYAEHHPDEELDDGFAQRFGVPLPDVFNVDQQLTIVASELDPTSDRIVEYLAEGYGVPVNAVFFRHFADGDHDYLARTWLLSPSEVERRRPPSGAKVRPWNGRDYYVVLGRRDDLRWDVARRFGLLTGGGGPFYWKPLRHLAPGHRVFAYVGGAGYVGVGTVTGKIEILREVVIQTGDNRKLVIDDPGFPEVFRANALVEDPDLTEYAVPVKWEVQVPVEEAVMEKGLFAIPTTAAMLRDERTIEFVSNAFQLQDLG